MNYYRTILNKLLVHLAESKDIGSFLRQSSENMAQMRNTYQTLGSVSAFIKWLEAQADAVDAGLAVGSASFQIMGGE